MTTAMISLLVFAGLVVANLPLVPLRPLAADGASFALAAVRIGQPHLPYPIHTILSIPLARLSSTNPAWGVNLLSTVAAAATCAVVYVLVVHLARRIAPATRTNRTVIHLLAIAAVIQLAVSVSLWQSSVVAEVYALNALLTITWMALMILWDRTGSSRFLVGSSFALFLSLGTNYLNLAFIPLWVLFVATSARRTGVLHRSTTVGIGVAALLGIGQFGYVLLRPYGPPPDVATFGRYWDFNLGPQVMNYLRLGSFGGGGGAEPLRFLGAFLKDEFLLAVPIALLGGFRWWQRDARTAWVATAVFVINRITVMLAVDDPTYTPDVALLLIPSNVVFALAIGAGLLAAYEVASERVSTRIATGLIAIVAAVLLALPARAHMSTVSKYRSEADETWEYSHRLLQQVEPKSVILTDWMFGTPLWFYQRAEGLRGDVDVISLWPHEYGRYLDGNNEARAVYLTHQRPENIAGLGARVFMEYGWMTAYQLSPATSSP